MAVLSSLVKVIVSLYPSFLTIKNHIIINANPNIIPGIKPDMNNLVTERFVAVPKTIIGILGGIIGAITALAQIKAHDLSSLYPAAFIMGIKMPPNAAASATALPERPEKTILANIAA